MILIIKKSASAEQVEDLQDKLRAFDLDSTLSRGEGRDVVVVLGETRGIDLEGAVQDHPAVEGCVPILPQRRYESTFSRRSFLDVMVASGAGLVAVAAAVVSLLFLGRSGEERRQRSILRVGSATDFDRRPYRVVDHEGVPILVVRSVAGAYHALSAICTHSEVCQVVWSAQRQELQCPCHRAAFDLFGNVLHGPPPKPLRSYPVELIGGSVYLKVRG